MEETPVCGAQTIKGTTCKNRAGQDGKCWIHRGPQCSVCFASMGPGSERTLPCGHQFHTRCIDRWKRSCTGDPTCPMCREPFDLPVYRCRLIIERVNDNHVDTINYESSNILNIVEGFGLDFRTLNPYAQGRFVTDIHFDIEYDENLNEVLQDLGLPTPPNT